VTATGPRATPSTAQITGAAQAAPPGPTRRVRQRMDRVRRGPRPRAVLAREDGSSGIEFVILFPVVAGLLLGGPQLAMASFAHEAAEGAAQAGARAGAAYGAGGQDGATAATAYLDTLGTGTITSYTVSQAATPGTVAITITARVPNVVPLPGFTPSVTVTVTRPRERFTTPAGP